MIDVEVYIRSVEWLLSGETGASSEYILAEYLGIIGVREYVPLDNGDINRCVKMLRFIPEAREALDYLRNKQNWEIAVVRIEKELSKYAI